MKQASCALEGLVTEHMEPIGKPLKAKRPRAGREAVRDGD
jgi:hypothetical protein